MVFTFLRANRLILMALGEGGVKSRLQRSTRRAISVPPLGTQPASLGRTRATAAVRPRVS